MALESDQGVPGKFARDAAKIPGTVSAPSTPYSAARPDRPRRLGGAGVQRDLVERAQEGDHDAFATLVAAALRRLDTAARLILRDPELAKDTVQETLVRAWRDLPTLRDPERWEAWIHRLLVRACYDELRKRKRRPVEVELNGIDRIAPFDALRSLQDRDELERGFRRLDADQRVVVVLHYYLDLPLPDVAATLGVPVGTVKSRLHRGLAAMRLVIGARADVGVAKEVVG
jgi:RNA polymerase sigma-70 factor (ECF subfamily)